MDTTFESLHRQKANFGLIEKEYKGECITGDFKPGENFCGLVASNVLALSF